MTVINLDEINVVNTEKGLLEQDYILEKYDEGYNSIFQSIKIETYEQLEWLISEHKKVYKKKFFIFRGQRNCHWIPISSLERMLYPNIPFEYIAAEHLENFRQRARGKIKEQFLLKKSFEPENIRELWAVGQHMGLKTPLLDWTYSLFVALYFAFEEENQDSSFCSVYCLNAIHLDFGRMYVGELFEPISDPYGRLTAQQGLFTTHNAIPYITKLVHRNIDNKKFNIDTARKYFIAKELRQEILDHLDFLGITKETIYPDLAGVIMQVNSDLSSTIQHYQNRFANQEK
ncbi:FRG domain-containing protein [Gallibacterium salpingitidis]|uniref:FRG domain-containing protein n=1 Tax=Gallibacterium salpingitidis TaxID=505341 RepID=UPI00083590AB|nr:FRG domain-containing protein [Gallibacterium salpingitidis]